MAKIILRKKAAAAILEKLQLQELPQYYLGLRGIIPSASGKTLSSSQVSKIINRKGGVTVAQAKKLAKWLGVFSWEQIVE